jgi:hypothetical protein
LYSALKTLKGTGLSEPVARLRSIGTSQDCWLHNMKGPDSLGDLVRCGGRLEYLHRGEGVGDTRVPGLDARLTMLLLVCLRTQGSGHRMQGYVWIRTDCSARAIRSAARSVVAS